MAFSDLLTNTHRGILAEFLVAKAVGSANQIRKEWDAFDVMTADGLKIEVKSAAYVQSWDQAEPSKIIFDIARKKSWNADSNEVDFEACRSADIYVFALLDERSRHLANPIDLNQWTFLVLPTTTLETLGNQRSISLGSLRKLNPTEVKFGALASAIKTVRMS